MPEYEPSSFHFAIQMLTAVQTIFTTNQPNALQFRFAQHNNNNKSLKKKMAQKTQFRKIAMRLIVDLFDIDCIIKRTNEYRDQANLWINISFMIRSLLIGFT